MGEEHRQIENDSAGAALAAADHHPKGVGMGPAALKEAEIDMAGIAEQFTAVDSIETKVCQGIPAHVTAS